MKLIYLSATIYTHQFSTQCVFRIFILLSSLLLVTIPPRILQYNTFHLFPTIKMNSIRENEHIPEYLSAYVRTS